MRDIKTILVNSSTTIRDTMRAIDKGAIRMALIVDEKKRLKGIVTDGDIRRGILKGLDINQKISEVMNKNPLYVKEKTSQQEILNLLKTEKILGVPLVNKDKVVKDMILLEGSDLIYYTKHKIEKRHLNKILVIGGTGYIGSVLVRKLLNRGYKVKVLDKFLYGKESLEDIKNSNLEIIEGDTRHVEDVTEAAKDVDAVVHLAELVGDPASELNPKFTQDVNYLATKLIASVCKHYQINRLVYTSSCSVYGACEGDELLSEISELKPVSLYAKMKIASETALLEMVGENFSPTILRLGTVFGLSYRPRFDLVVNLFIAKALKEGKITIFGGDQWRPNVHVSDVAKAIISVLEVPIDKVAGEIFNVGTEEQNYTINEIGKIIKKEIPSAELVTEDRKIDKRDYKVDFSKIREKLNFRPDKTIKDAVIEIKKFLEENKDIDYKDYKYSNIAFLNKNNKIPK